MLNTYSARHAASALRATLDCAVVRLDLRATGLCAQPIEYVMLSHGNCAHMFHVYCLLWCLLWRQLLCPRPFRLLCPLPCSLSLLTCHFKLSFPYPLPYPLRPFTMPLTVPLSWFMQCNQYKKMFSLHSFTINAQRLVA